MDKFTAAEHKFKNPNEPSYCDQRLALYGITEEFNRVKIFVNSEESYKTHPEYLSYPIFAANDTNDIEITYLELNGSLVTFRGEGRKWVKTYKRLRLNPINAKPDQKYTQPAGSGVHVHLNPRIIEKFGKGETINTLYMVEGEFKGWCGFIHGLDIIGLPSIHAYKEKAHDELHETIREIIRVCKVENLVMIYDADIHEVKWNKFELDENYDLGKRANLFYASARNIRDYAKRLVKDVYLCHLTTDCLAMYNGNEQVKGLDDLYLHFKGKEKEVTDDLLKLRSSKKMFNYVNITAESPAKIREFFHLTRDKNGAPMMFYSTHQSKLHGREFVFLGFRYKYDNIKEGLTVVKHPDSEKFVRVACDYIKVITIPENIRGIKVLRRKLEPWKAGEITRDYVNKGYKNFFDTIPKYDQFTVYPENSNGYKQIIDNCFNMYYQVMHTPAPGKWETIEMFLNHLFEEQIEMCYDYLQLLYTQPTQTLPIIALVSEDRGTGKTKFLEFLREAFNENVTILGNDAITDNYNDDYASKLIIGIDEGLIEKKATVEKIKSWSTATRIKMNTKFVSRQEIPFYGKIIITSNNVDSFIQIEDKETRFWVRKIQKIKKEDPDLMDKIIKQIPAFLHFLTERKMKHPKVTRQWFDNDLLKTQALKDIVESSHGWVYKELITLLEEEFFKYQYHCLHYTLKELVLMLNGPTAGAKFRANDIKNNIEKKLKIKSYQQRADFPVYDAEGKSKTLTKKENGRYFRFYIEQILNEEAVKEIGYDLEVLKEIHAGADHVELWPGQKVPVKVKQEALSFEEEKGIQSANTGGDDLPF